jgi:Na+/melibiose symporter-like transporter
MKRLAGSVPGYDLDYEFACLREQIHVSEEITRSYSDNDWKALIQWGNFKRCIAASLPFAGQQLCGVPYIFFYNTYFFQSAGLSDPFQASVIINCIYLASIIASFFLVDKIGRRPLVIYGLAVLGVLNILIGALGFIPGESSPKGSALTAMCSLWMCAFGLTLSPLGEFVHNILHAK